MQKIIRIVLKTDLTKQEIFENIKCVYSGACFLNTSYKTESAKNFSYIGYDPFCRIMSKGNTVTVADESGYREICGNPLKCLDEIISENRVRTHNEFDFIAGGIGYFSYDLKNIIEHLPALAKRDVDIPDMYFNFFRTILVFEESNAGKITAFFLFADKSLDKRITQLKNFAVIPPKPSGSAYAVKNLVSNFTKNSYINAVAKVKRYIRDGDIFQVCLSQRFKSDFKGSPWALYKNLDSINPAPFSAYFDLDIVKIISSSPELFLRIKDGIVITKPMKGTRPRDCDVSTDKRNMRDLISSRKDDAELSMIVDLERNDLGKICKPGSIAVVKHREIEKYASVFQTTSTVAGNLPQKQYSVEKIIRSVFPGGSISGCPKIRAMEIIDELEPTARNIYTGALGYISFHNTMTLNVGIRIITIIHNKLYFQTGGGIVADSNEENEYTETLVKAESIKSALGL